MDKLIGFIVLSCLLSAPARADDRLPVVASLPDLGAIAAAIGGDKVQVTTIASGVQDPHFVDPKPSYVVKLRDAELFFVNGLDLEIGWVPPLLDSARNGKIRVGAPGYVDCSKDIPVLEIPSGTVTRAEGDVHPFGNPHYATDPLNGKIIAATISAALSRARPNDAAYFAEHLRSFQQAIDGAVFGKALVELVGGKKLDRLARSGELTKFLADERADGAPLSDKLGGWLGAMKALRGEKLVLYHKSFSYFLERFGMIAAAYVEPKPGIQPGPEHLAEVVALMRQEHIKLIATHPFYDEKIAKLVADKGGAKLVVLPLSVGGVRGADDYFKFFDVVTNSLLRAAK